MNWLIPARLRAYLRAKFKKQQAKTNHFVADARPRFLFVANGPIPTLQLSFLVPLDPLVRSGQIQVMPLYDDDLKESGRRASFLKEIFNQTPPDLVIFCRYSGPYAQEILHLCKASSIKSIYHIDDDLLNVPKEIGEKKFAFHNDPKRKSSIDFLLKNVDMIYCSTENLLKRLQSYGYSVPMTFGKIYCAGRVLADHTPESRTFGYMGFDHAHDLEQVCPAIVDVLHMLPDVRFELFGSIPKPALLEPFGDRVRVIEPVRDYNRFLEFLADLKWAVGICPLADTPFNVLKANTKWVEYTAAGFPVIATADTIYDDCLANNRGLLLANDIKQWADAIAGLLNDPEARIVYVARSQAYLNSEYSEEMLRHQILKVFKAANSNLRL